MERKLTEVLDVTADLFRTAKRIRKKHGKYMGVLDAVFAIENAAIFNMCGTGNINAEEYIECYYDGIINLENLLSHLAYPHNKDRESGINE